MVLLLLLATLAAPASQRPTDVVQWLATGPAASVAAGETVQIVLTAQIQNDWKLYALTQPPGGPQKLSIAVAQDSPFTLAQKQIIAPAPKKMKDENFGTDSMYYERAVTFTLPVVVAKRASGQAEIPLEITFQACGAELCLRPFTQKLSVPVTVR